MNTPSRWPSNDELSQLLAGRLPLARQAEIEALLEADDALRQHLEILAGGSSWVGRAGGNSANSATVLSEEDHALLAAMDGLKAQAGSATVSPGSSHRAVTLNFLSPSDNPAALGRLNHYDVLELVGSGGFGIVLKAQDAKLNRIVAIKVLSPHLAAHGIARKRFLREAQTAAAVSHDHIVTIHGIDEATPYIVMEYVDGMSLQQLIDRDGPLEVAKVLRIASQTAAGLAAAHKQGQIHRDIKPANILLENGVQRVKITDFGLARAADDASLTQSGVVAGTPQYMAPEQARGESVDYRADLFSLGSVMYTMCTGRPAFRADSAVAVLRRVCDDQPRPIRELNPEVPAWLAAIIEKLMAKRPEDRYASAQEVSELLNRCLAHVQQPELAPLPQELPVLSREVQAIGQVQALGRSSAGTQRIVPREIRQVGVALAMLGGVNLLLMATPALAFLSHAARGGEHPVMWLTVFGGLAMLPLALASVAMIVGGIQVLQMRSWAWGVLAAVLAMLTPPAIIFGLFVGIWALLVLFDERVRSAFSGGALVPPATHKPQQFLDSARERVYWPAIGLRWVGVLNCLAIGVMGVIFFAMRGPGAFSDPPFYAVVLVLAILTFASGLILYASFAMQQLRLWPLAIAASFLAMIIGPGSIIGLFIGIWALVVLLQRDVRDAFSSANALLPRGAGYASTRPVPAGAVSAIVAVALLPVLLIGGYFISHDVERRPSTVVQEFGSTPATPTAVRDGVMRLNADRGGLQVFLEASGSTPHHKHQWNTDEARTMSFHGPAGTYLIRAYEQKSEKLFFERRVVLRENDNVTIDILPQAKPARIVAPWTSIGYIDASVARSVTLSPDGSLLAVGLKSGEIALETKEGREKLRFTVGDPQRAAISHDNKYVACLGAKDPATRREDLGLCLYEIATKEVRYFHPTGKHSDGKFKNLGDVRRLAFSPDGKTVCAVSAYSSPRESENDSEFRSVVLRWDVSTRDELPPLLTQDGIADQVVFPAEKSEWLFTAASAASVPSTNAVFWDVANVKQAGKYWQRDRFINALAASPQAGWTFAAISLVEGATQSSATSPHYIQTLSTRKGPAPPSSEERGLWGVGLTYYTPTRVAALALSNSGKVLAASQEDNKILLFRAARHDMILKTGELLEAQCENGMTMAFTPDDRELLVASPDGTVRRYDVQRWTTAAAAATAEVPMAEAPVALSDWDERVRLAQNRVDLATKNHAVGNNTEFDLLDANIHLKDAEIHRAEAIGDARVVIKLVEEQVQLRQQLVDQTDVLYKAGNVTLDVLLRRQEELTDAQILLKKAKPLDRSSIDLIPLIKPGTGEGTWPREVTRLVAAPQAKAPYLALPLMPGDEYVLEAVVEHFDGQPGAITFGLRTQDKPFCITLNQPHDNKFLTGIGDIGGKKLTENDTSIVRPGYLRGAQQRVRCTVRKSNITVTVNGDALVMHDYDPQSLGIEPARPDPFFLEAAANTGYRVAELKLYTLEQAAAGAPPITGRWTSPHGEVDFSHPALSDSAPVKLSGKWFLDNAAVTGQYDPAARVIHWTFRTSSGRTGVCRHGISADGQLLKGRYTYDQPDRPTYDWELRRVSR